MPENPVHYFKTEEQLSTSIDVAIIGAGFGSLSAAAILAKKGLSVAILEQNYLPGGCTSSYLRKGYIFETGATTLVGLDEGMPLKAVMDIADIQFKAEKLKIPMLVHLKNGQIITRYQDRNLWIAEAERVFGSSGQKEFWEQCFQLSDFVWNTSVKQKKFPPQNLSDLLYCAYKSSPSDILNARFAFKSTFHLLKNHGLNKNPEFVDFVNEQLKITAQNNVYEVNALFGATALCYTNYSNYYVHGGLIQLVKAFTDNIAINGGKLFLKTTVNQIDKTGNSWKLTTNKGDIIAKNIISGIPVNNLTRLIDEALLPAFLQKKTMPVSKLNGAVQLGIAFKSSDVNEVLHHQIHHDLALGFKGSNSIFISYASAKDNKRAEEGITVASVSTHVSDLENSMIDKELFKEKVIEKLQSVGLLKKEDIAYTHVSDPHDWQDWTLREAGFVGGYPQFKSVLPWQMIPARISKSLYACGDSIYPGQGIPGVALSGMLAAERLLSDFK
jgi:C-3',4' desaturase CrtD